MKAHRFCLFLLSIATAPLFAGQATSNVEFVQVAAKNSQFVIIKLVTDATDRPACATDPRMIESLTTEAGKAILSIATAAQVSGRKLFVKGTDQCDVYSSMETISYIRLLDD